MIDKQHPENVAPIVEQVDVATLQENVNEEEVNEVTEAIEEETYREMSPFNLILRRFFRSKLSVVGLIMIVFLFLFSFLGPVVYGRYIDEEGEDMVDRTPTIAYTYKTVVYIVGEDGTMYRETDANKDSTLPRVTVTERLSINRQVNSYADPSIDHLLGTDDQGYDVFTRLMRGGKISLTIGFVVVILETIIGVILGGLAGYFGGWVDSIIMRIVDIFNCIPTLPILLIASAVIDGWKISGAITADQQIYVLMIIITLFSWSGIARMVRGQILSLREQEYITATEVMGLPTWRKIFLHLIPNVMPQLIVSMTLGLGSVILYESTLSYLGLGVPVGKAAWGTMISVVNSDPTALQYHVNTWLPAGLLIVVAVLGFNFVGDGLRDAMDPKAKK